MKGLNKILLEDYQSLLIIISQCFISHQPYIPCLVLNTNALSRINYTYLLTELFNRDLLVDPQRYEPDRCV